MQLVLLCTLKIRARDIAVFMHAVRCFLLLSLMLELKFFDEQYLSHVNRAINETSIFITWFIFADRL